MAILLKSKWGNLNTTITYWPLVDGELKRYIDNPNVVVEETFPGEINKELKRQEEEKLNSDVFSVGRKPS